MHSLFQRPLRVCTSYLLQTSTLLASSRITANYTTLTTTVMSSSAASASSSSRVQFDDEEYDNKQSKYNKRNSNNHNSDETATGNNTHDAPGAARSKQGKSSSSSNRGGGNGGNNKQSSRNNKSSKSSPPQVDRIPNDLTEKKRPMRSVEDVLNRIKHDPVVNGADKDLYLPHFVVAYIDRVFGDQEIAFDEFFSNTDYKEIPLHRISYLRYCDEIVWNRATKYDAIFGSSNTDLTLQSWLDRTEELVEQQEERWAWILAEEKEIERRDAQLLKDLDRSIEEQKESIAAMQGEFESKSAMSEFDFGERDEDEDEDEECEDEEEEKKDSITESRAVPMIPAAACEWGGDQEVIAAAAPNPAFANTNFTNTNFTNTNVAAATSTPAAATSATPNVLDAVESLPPRAARGARAPARASAAAKPAASAPAVVAPAPTAAPLAASSSAAPPSASSDASTITAAAPRAACEDDSNIAFTVSLFDPSISRLSAPIVIRASMDHFDWPFLRKRVASKLKLKNGVKDVRRMYLHVNDGENVKLTEENFARLLKNESRVVLMAELDAMSDPLALMTAPKANSAEEANKDKEQVERAKFLAMKDRKAQAKLAEKSVEKSDAASAASSSSSSSSRSSKPPSNSNARPNYFISLRITNPTILSALTRVQSALTVHDARYSAFLVPDGTYHITLSLLCVNGEEQLKTAQRVLQECEAEVNRLLTSDTDAEPTLHIKGISNFNDSVVFADLPRCDGRSRLNRVAGMLSLAFEKAGVGCDQNFRNKSSHPNAEKKPAAKGSSVFIAPQESVEEQESFTPHLTIAKMSRAPRGNDHGKDNRRGKDNKSSASKPSRPQENTGVIELAEEKDAKKRDQASKPANQFASLTDSSAVTNDDATPSSSSSATIVNPSTSVIRRIDSASYREFVSHDFGQQPIQTLELCSMGGAKQADGYYRVEGAIKVGKVL